MKYIVDTCIFNKLVDGGLRLDDLPSDGQFVATHIQADELSKTKDSERRERLLLKFSQIAPTRVPTESFVFDVSRFDQSKWSNCRTLQTLKTALDASNGGKSNNIQDALIAEVAIVNGFALLTADYDLANVAKQHGAHCQYLRGATPPATSV
jgi:predicted nucleic acid-binding protein